MLKRVIAINFSYLSHTNDYKDAIIFGLRALAKKYNIENLREKITLMDTRTT